MATRIIRRGETESSPFSLADGDALIVADGGTLATSGAAAITVAGPVGRITNSGTITRTTTGAAIVGALSGELDLVIANRAGATIEGGERAIQLTSGSSTTGAVRLVNDGRIDGNANNAIDFDGLNATTIRIVNGVDGLIENSGASDVVRPGNDRTTQIVVVNAGTIRAGDTAGVSEGGDGVDLQPQDGGVDALVINRDTGLIMGGKHGVTGGNGARIVNEEGGSIIGRNGSGINFDTEAADGDGAVTVVNHGLISGRYDGLGDGDGDGVDVDYLVKVKNHGTIEGIGADNEDDFGDGIAAGGGSIENTASGTIHGETNGILIDDGDRNGAYAETVIVNDGVISGELGHAIRLIGEFADRIQNTGTIRSDAGLAIDAGAGNDRVVNQGTIVGDVALGDGDDQYRGTLAIDGMIDGGAGDDLIFAGQGGDRLVGGAGQDVLSGGTGADRFVYDLVSDSVVAAADLIRGFGADDVLDLSGVDADANADGDQAFAYVGFDAFSGTAGELRQELTQRGTMLLGDVDGDGSADFAVAFDAPLDTLAIQNGIVF